MLNKQSSEIKPANKGEKRSRSRSILKVERSSIYKKLFKVREKRANVNLLLYY